MDRLRREVVRLRSEMERLEHDRDEAMRSAMRLADVAAEAELETEDQARSEMERLEGERDNLVKTMTVLLDETIEPLRTRAEAAEAQLAQAREALREFGQHKKWACEMLTMQPPLDLARCTCGFNAALARLEQGDKDA